MPVMPGYTHADTPHPATIQPAGYRYGCSSVRTGDTSPRGGQTRYLAHPWRYAGPAVVETTWLPKPCGHGERANDPACEGCENQHQPPA